MLCQRCKKKLATVHITDNDGGVRNVNLCEDCAAEEGLTVKKHVAPADLLNALVMSQQAAISEASTLTCPECRLTYGEFRQSGLLGCPHCYSAFDSQLSPLLERAHDGVVEHYGKVPRRPAVNGSGTAAPVDSAKDVARLRRELKAALEREDYESAAKCRDQIRQLESRALEPKAGDTRANSAAGAGTTAVASSGAGTGTGDGSGKSPGNTG